MGKLKTLSPIYCIIDNWENMLNLTHTLDKIYLKVKIGSGNGLVPSDNMPLPKLMVTHIHGYPTCEVVKFKFILCSDDLNINHILVWGKNL